ncbi:MAG: cytochrome c oxidase, cbb3-type, CcoQ subunit [Campylobacterota bacterium]|nr:cytochrome c oxidase, cbb3-type, CcoQ subunit [Campylobacterota bacterium]
MDIAQLQAYGYFILVFLLVVILYSYIYHLYKNRKSSSGIDYEEYSNIALNDDITATPIEKNEKREA